ncbi:methyltransferase family protein [Mycoplasma sp. P36-A1]|uniref:methyltransferase family protein n=1 Tax=Mycoplasma sp. P36-A1 TaxID=3252900 RepID=UPI003C305557
MINPLIFDNILEMNVVMNAFVVVFFVEFAAMFVTIDRYYYQPNKQLGFQTIWLVMLGWFACLIAGPFFRSSNVPEILANMVLPHFIFYLGVIIMIIGIVFHLVAIISIKKTRRTSIKDQSFISSGIYSVVRNPGHAGSIITVIGLAMTFRSLPAIIFVIVVSMITYYFRIKNEEQYLETNYKEEYNTYKKATKYRLFPGIY